MQNNTVHIGTFIHDYEWCTFDLLITTDTIKTHASFLGYSDSLKSFGQQLECFPESIASRVKFEAGVHSPSDTHVILEAYCYDLAGHAALRVFTDNQSDDPAHCRMEFSIPAEIASINRLGRLLSGLSTDTDSEIIWEAQTS